MEDSLTAVAVFIAMRSATRTSQRTINQIVIIITERTECEYKAYGRTHIPRLHFLNLFNERRVEWHTSKFEWQIDTEYATTAKYESYNDFFMWARANHHSPARLTFVNSCQSHSVVYFIIYISRVSANVMIEWQTVSIVHQLAFDVRRAIHFVSIAFVSNESKMGFALFSYIDSLNTLITLESLDPIDSVAYQYGIILQQLENFVSEIAWPTHQRRWSYFVFLLLFQIPLHRRRRQRPFWRSHSRHWVFSHYTIRS